MLLASLLLLGALTVERGGICGAGCSLSHGEVNTDLMDAFGAAEAFLPGGQGRTCPASRAGPIDPFRQRTREWLRQAPGSTTSRC